MVAQCAERLILQRALAGIELESTARIRPSRPGRRAARTRQFHIVDRGHGAPDIHRSLRRRLAGQRIDQFDVGRQRHHDPDQSVLPEVAEIVCLGAVGAKVVGVDGAKQRVVGARIPEPSPFQSPEPRLHAGRRQLELVMRHVTVGTGPAVALQAEQMTIGKCERSTDDGIAGLASAQIRRMVRGGPRRTSRRRGCSERCDRQTHGRQHRDGQHGNGFHLATP